jgi:hypothetical protein
MGALHCTHITVSASANHDQVDSKVEPDVTVQCKSYKIYLSMEILSVLQGRAPVDKTLSKSVLKNLGVPFCHENVSTLLKHGRG